MNSDWFTLLLFLIFFVFPLIQQIVEAAKRKQAPPPPHETGAEEDWPAEGFPGAEARRGREVVVEQRSGAGWSEGWGDWPVDTSGQEPESSYYPESLEVIPEPVRVEVAPAEEALETAFEPVSLPATRYASYDLVESLESEAAALSVTVLPQANRGGVAVPRPDIAGVMRSPGRLRDAIILSEVLGPPKALRDGDIDVRIG